ncbi:CRISPR-associated protein Cas2 [Desulfohalotomaculum tongense]|uniref:CRISPR-associated endonuclease Cas2 n=1 Tax=Desulforadius tongensis TaxID=1216062 RepID=UPI00195E0E25|nr:CRISPR-associated endonuclease Cas2 [Desulforadius tongensis]MBM7854985.1 CRISPR-associated protein Cas2 [Desulforadius tongensis]
MENIVITYDIRDDRRREKVRKTLKDYGVPVQYSVFECRLRKEDVLSLRYKLDSLIKKNEDSIIFYRQCPRCSGRVDRLGMSFDPFGDGLYIITGGDLANEDDAGDI